MAGRTWLKLGVMGQLSIQAQKAFGKVARLYHDNGEDFFVTSIMESNHSPGSLHYNGNAFDFQHGGIKISVIKRVLGNDFDCVVSNNGAFHVEYDPK
jgi:hypothetical protein|tara:strand:+ start:3107 stop:3397 length:291 start_codon:yes stop_codon:yes gene_type:complete